MPLRIGVVPGVTPDRWVRAWRARYPHDPLTVVALSAAAAEALGGEVDMAFLRLPPTGADLETLHVIPLWEETPVVVAGRDHPVQVFDAVTLADLDGEQQVEGWDDAALDIVAAGHGIARMPQSVLRAAGRRDLVGRPITDAEPSRVGLVWRRADASPAIDAFIGVVRGRTEASSRGEQSPQPDRDRQAPRRPEARTAPRSARRRPR